MPGPPRSCGSRTRTTSVRCSRSRATWACRSRSAAAATAAPPIDGRGRDRPRRARPGALEIDVAGRTAWVGAGPDGRRGHTALAEHGLAIGFGDTGRSGSAGITLGGGIGYLVRKYGMTIDNLLAAEIVTADGEVLRVDADDEPRPVLGDPRRRRQLRRRDPVPVPPRTRSAQIVGGMLVLPATAETVAGLHRRGRGGARGALVHRQRHALPADAVRAPRRTTASS